MGSIIFPKSEIIFFFLAKNPSKKSVTDANIKIMNATSKDINVFFNMRPIHIKDKKMRKNVSWLGRFIAYRIAPFVLEGLPPSFGMALFCRMGRL